MRTSTRTLLFALLALAALWLAGCGNVFLPPPPDTPTVSPTATSTGPEATATSLPEPLPTLDVDGGPFRPQLVSAEPASGQSVAIALDEDAEQVVLRWRFDQPMDAASMAAALRISPELDGELVWESDRVVALVPSTPSWLTPGTRYSVAIDAAGAASVDGLPLNQDVAYTFATLPPLVVTSVSPADGASGVRGDAHITLVFNQPVVPESCSGVPAGADDVCPALPLMVSPSGACEGGWLNPATYACAVRAGLTAGTEHSVVLLAGLSGLEGAVLADDHAWSFVTSPPEVMTVVPEPGQRNVLLDTEIRVVFRTPMDTVTTGEALSVVAEDGTPVAGAVTWTDGGVVLVFTPLDLLNHDTAYRVRIGERARALRSTPLVDPPVWDFRTVLSAEVVGISPEDGATGVSGDEPVRIAFAGALGESAVRASVTVTSTTGVIEPYGAYDREAGVATLTWDRAPGAEYCVEVAGIRDTYARSMTTPRRSCFRTGDPTPLLRPEGRGDVVTLDAARASVVGMLAQGVGEVDFTLSEVDVPAVTGVVTGGTVLREWTEAADIPADVSATIPVSLRRLGGALPTGLFRLDWRLPGNADGSSGGVSVAVVDQHVTVKLSEEEALVWVADLATGAPVTRTEVQLLDAGGLLIAGGTTDEAGLARLTRPGAGLDRTLAAVTGQPGGEGFGFALVTAQVAAVPSAFGVASDLGPRPPYGAYLRSDRATYAPGETVRITGHVREHLDGVYRLPRADQEIDVILSGPDGMIVDQQTLPLSATGRFDAKVSLPPWLVGGVYVATAMMPTAAEGTAPIPLAATELRVAPAGGDAMVVTVTATATDVVDGAEAIFVLQARDALGRGVEDLAIPWEVRAFSQPFIPTSAVVGNGDSANSWRWHTGDDEVLVREAASGAALTDALGRAQVVVPTALMPAGGEAAHGPQMWLLDAGLEGDGPSAAASVVVHPADLYLGLRPVTWVAREKERLAVDLVATDWQGKATAGQSVRLELDRRAWGRDVDGGWVFTDTLVSDQTVTTSDAGPTGASFTAPRSGSYVVKATTTDVEDREVHTEVCLWVAGPDAAAWPISGAALVLVADQSSYQVAETAHVLVPTPFAGPFDMLVTVERDGILDVQHVSSETANPVLDVEIATEYAPNVTLSVTLLRPGDDGRATEVYAGFTTLNVSTPGRHVIVEATAAGTAFVPGASAEVAIRTSDASGRPVSADVALVVRSGGSAGWSSGPDEVFHGLWPLRVLTGDGLLPLDLPAPVHASPHTSTAQAGPGRSDGAGEAVAFWATGLLTDARGEATVTVPLPKTQAAWELTAWAVTEDAGTGETRLALSTLRPLDVLLLPPAAVAPGDTLELAALVHNRSDVARVVDVGLTPQTNLTLEGAQAYRVELAGGEGRRLSWQVAVPDTSIASDPDAEARAAATIVAQSAGLFAQADVMDPLTGEAGLPVRSTLPAAAVSLARVMVDDHTVEAITVPGDASAETQLVVRVDASLRSLLARGLDDTVASLAAGMSDTPSAWADALLQALAAYDVLAASQGGAGVSETAGPVLQASLDALYGLQNHDGGWGWTQGESAVRPSAEVSLAILRGGQLGFSVRADRLARALDYLVETLDQEVSRGAREPTHALTLRALSEAGRAWPEGAGTTLYAARDELGLEGRAHLMVAFGLVDASDTRVATLIGELGDSAIRAVKDGPATGGAEDAAPAEAGDDGPATLSEAVLGREAGAVTHWEETGRDAGLTSVGMTALVADALLRLGDPGDTAVFGAVTWLLEQRGPWGWATLHEAALATVTVADFVAAHGDVGSDAAVVVKLNGEPLRAGDLAEIDGVGGTGLLVRLGMVPGDAGTPALRPGRNVLEFLRGEGGGVVFTSLALITPAAQDAAASESHGLYLSRSYCATAPDVPTETCTPVQRVAMGEMVEVRLLVTVPQPRHAVRLEDALPAGFELVNGSTRARSFHPTLGPTVLPGGRLSFEAPTLIPGVHEVVYRVRAISPGSTTAGPARVWETRFPDVMARTGAARLTVEGWGVD